VPAVAGAKEDEEKAEKTEEEKAKEKEEALFFKKMMGVPEAEVFVQLLVTIFLLDKQSMQEAMASATLLIQRATSFNRRTMVQLQSKGYFYWARCMELMGKSNQIRQELLTAYRTCSLKHDQVGQATLLNLLLRNYLDFNLYEQADTLMRKTAFPEGDASNNQLARYLYYTGRIKAVQLEYTDAFRNLQQAQRKAPQSSALGFRKTVIKFQTIVQLLIGEIPDRSTFSQKGMVAALRPYLHITQAVRVGDLTAFHKAMQEHSNVFKTDKTYSLIVRLRHNVIKTGLKKINTAYSAITLQDVCTKLGLDSVSDTEFIVAKCIQDGVIDATLDHEAQTMTSKANLDIYTTSEPQIQLHKRVAFCLDMHNQAVKAMRYAENTKTEWESAEERRERLKQEEEALISMEEDDF
jgi:26S proteasome regulatory subunit N3